MWALITTNVCVQKFALSPGHSQLFDVACFFHVQHWKARSGPGIITKGCCSSTIQTRYCLSLNMYIERMCLVEQIVVQVFAWQYRGCGCPCTSCQYVIASWTLIHATCNVQRETKLAVHCRLHATDVTTHSQWLCKGIPHVHVHYQ